MLNLKIIKNALMDPSHPDASSIISGGKPMGYIIGGTAGGGGPTGDALILEDGSGFLLLEDGSYLLLE